MPGKREDDSQFAALCEAIDQVNRLNRLSERCVNVVIRLQFLRYYGRSGYEDGLAALEELEAVVAELPPLPLSPDPFCQNDVVELAGIHATSAHAAAYDLAVRAHNALQFASLTASEVTRPRSAKKENFTRVTFDVQKKSWRDEPWSKDRWQSICERLRNVPDVELKRWEARLILEQNQLQRHFEEQGALMELMAPAKPRKRPATGAKQAKVRDKKMEARNRWIYYRCKRGDQTYDQIADELRGVAETRRWPLCESKQRIYQIAVKYAEDNKLPPPPSRRNL
jgi:hypothetical protein